jgi:hypothetical protein
MSNVFRRPMFRGGPTNMNGIMSGIQDRKNYADGPEDPNIKSLITKAKELEPAMQEIMGPYEKPSGFEDPLVQLAIQSGLDLMSNAGSQSLIRNIGQTGSRQAPVYFKNLAEQRVAKREYDRGIKSGAIGLAGDILGKEISASGKEEREPVREVTIRKYLEQGLPARVSQRAADFELDEADKLRAKVTGARVPAGSGVVEFDLSNVNEVKANENFIKKEYDGKFVYDPFEGNYKRIRVIDGQIYFDEFDSIDQIILTTAGADKKDIEKVDYQSESFGLTSDQP